MDVRVGLWRKLSAKELMLLKCWRRLESPLDCKEIQPVHSEGDQLWDFFGRTDAKAETPVLWPPHVKSWLIGKDSDAGRDWGQEEKGMTEAEMAGWHHWLDGRESGWTPGVGDGQGALRAAIHGVVKSQTRLSDWTELTELLYLLGPKLCPVPVSWMCSLSFYQWKVTLLASEERGWDGRHRNCSLRTYTMFLLTVCFTC